MAFGTAVLEQRGGGGINSDTNKLGRPTDT